LPQAFERWDGKGSPAGLRGAAIDPVMRVVQIADDAEEFHRLGGPAAALAMLADRAGTEFDPGLVATCHRAANVIFAELDDLDAWGMVIAANPTLDRRLSPAELLTVLETFADYADLKSPWFTGQSRATARLAAAAAAVAGCSAADVELCRRAGLVARLGVIGVSTGTWDKAGPLSGMEWERVRTVPYLTERVLSRPSRLAEVGAVAGMRCERMDGSGYPRGLAGAAIPVSARLLAAADVYEALARARAHRPARPAGPREEVLRAEVLAGRLDAAAVNAVLTAAGHRAFARPAAVCGLTEREVEVLGLLARGRSNKEMARQLRISARTVGSHVEHIYAKIEVNTRGAAAMFAMRHGLVGDDSPPPIG
jgi:HD-GYP domain-containing protein (c-di-GMP phosphodiesterase class II)